MFESIALSVQEKWKIDFQYGHHGGHLGFLIGTILLFSLSTYHPESFLPSFESVGLLVQEKKWKIHFQDGHHDGHLEFPIRTILAIFDLEVTLMTSTKFQVNWAFGSEETRNRFSRWPPWWPSWISYWNDFSYFWSTSHPDASYQVLSQLKISYQNNFSYFLFTSHPNASYQVSSQLAFWFRRRSEK